MAYLKLIQKKYIETKIRIVIQAIKIIAAPTSHPAEIKNGIGNTETTNIRIEKDLIEREVIKIGTGTRVTKTDIGRGVKKIKIEVKKININPVMVRRSLQRNIHLHLGTKINQRIQINTGTMIKTEVTKKNIEAIKTDTPAQRRNTGTIT